MRKYKSKVEDHEFTWRVILLDAKTRIPFTWMTVDKEEFPTKRSAVAYLVRQYSAAH